MGYRLHARLEELECPAEVAPVGAGEEPLRVTVRTNLTFDELDGLPSGDRVEYRAIFAAIAPYVVGWNLTVDGTEVPVPAEVGPDAFRVVPPDVVVWLLEELRTGYRGGEGRKKRSPRRGGTGGR